MPVISSTLRRLVTPATRRTLPRRTPSAVATNASSASLAACSTGGAATLILRSAPWRPAISVRLARGWTYTAIRTLGGIDRLSLERTRGARRLALCLRMTCHIPDTREWLQRIDNTVDRTSHGTAPERPE